MWETQTVTERYIRLRKHPRGQEIWLRASHVLSVEEVDPCGSLTTLTAGSTTATVHVTNTPSEVIHRFCDSQAVR